MIILSDELEELLESEKEFVDEEEKEFGSKFLWLLMQHEGNFLHMTNDKVFVEEYPDYIGDIALVFTTVSISGPCNALTFVALKEIDSNWLD